MKKESTKKRESNLELLRIFAMVMIVFHHFAVHGNFNFDTENISINLLWHVFILMGGKIGVNIFVLISGYFLVKEKEIKLDLKHIIKFISQVLFYSVTIYLLYIFITKEQFNLKGIKEAFFPIIFKKWWFVTYYFILYLLHPFINKILINLSKKEYKTLLLILITCFSIIPTIINKEFSVDNIVWFITLYCIAGYIKLHGLPEKIKTQHYFLAILGLIIVNFLIVSLDINVYEAFKQHKLNTLLISISIFMLFKKIKIKNNKLINQIASATFGVYLIHDNSSIRFLMWRDLLNTSNFKQTSFFIPYTIMACIWVYISCTIIELLRKKIIEKPFLNIIDHIKQKAD